MNDAYANPAVPDSIDRDRDPSIGFVGSRTGNGMGTRTPGYGFLIVRDAPSYQPGKDATSTYGEYLNYFTGYSPTSTGRMTQQTYVWNLPPPFSFYAPPAVALLFR